MKKTVKIISTILLAVMLIATIAGTVYAKPDINTVINGVENGGNNVPCSPEPPKPCAKASGGSACALPPSRA